VTATLEFTVEERDWNPSAKAGWFAMAEAPPRTRPPLLTAEEIAALPADGRRRYDQARAAWHANLGPIRTPQVDAAFEALEEICGSNLQDGDKVRPAAVLDALPGLGKTTAALAFGRWFHREQVGMHGPRVQAGDWTWQRIPVAYLGLTSHTTMRSLNAMLCRFYGLPERGNADVLAHRGAECVVNCKTRLAEYLFARSTGHFASLMSLISRGCYRAVKTGAESLTAGLLDEVRIDQAAEDARGQLQALIGAGRLPARAGATAPTGTGKAVAV
jgi:hypothetical protein